MKAPRTTQGIVVYTQNGDGYSLDELEEIIASQLWGHIDNAPRDGTFILARTISGHRVIVQFCEEGYWRHDLRDEPETWAHVVEWRPLP